MVAQAGACPDATCRSAPCHRVGAILAHIPWYGFRTQARLARDSGVSEASISRLLRGQSLPTLTVALRLTAALEQRLGRPLPVQEVFALDGAYPTPSACALCGCRGCLPPQAYDRDDCLLPAYRGLRPGAWAVTAPALPPSLPPSLPSCLPAPSP